MKSKVLGIIVFLLAIGCFANGNTKAVLAEEMDVSEELILDESEASILVSESEPDENSHVDENQFRGSCIIGMDEDGNLYEVPDEIPEIEGISPRARITEALLVDFHTKSSSETTSYTEYGTGNAGYLNGSCGADAVYLGQENGKIKFMISGVIGLVDASEVKLVPISSVSSYSHYEVNSSGNLIHYIANDLGKTTYFGSVNNGPAPDYLSQGVKYWSYDGHYFYKEEQFAVMQSDYNAGHRNNAVNASNPFYNYFQYLPLRSVTSYTAEQLQAAINNRISSNSKMYNLGSAFVEMQDTYGINAVILTSIAALESNWGKSNICQTKNNLFGINAIDTSPGQSATTFLSPEACVKDYAETYLSKRYCRPSYSYYNGAFLGNKASGANVNYASAPYWGEQIAAVAWQLDKTLGNEDAYKYTIGIKDTISSDHANVNVRNEPSLSSTVIHKTSKVSNHAFLVLNDEPINGFYKIQSEGVLNSSRTAIDSSTGKYGAANMYLYISADYLTLVTDSKQTVQYGAHVSEIGWQHIMSDGNVAGTTGKALPIEAIKIEINNLEGVGVKYRTHVRDIGWQDYVTDWSTAGTTGRALSIEAIEIELTGVNANKYDIYYAAHVANVGWLDWAKNGASAGSSGYAYPMEAIKIQIVEKGGLAPGSTAKPYINKNTENTEETLKIPDVKYEAHVSDIGWMDSVENGALAGTTGKALALEALKISLENVSGLDISYSAHVSNIGWMDAVKNGEMAGTTGKALPMEAIKIELSGTNADKYDIYYRVHSANIGWLDWAKNGEMAGTQGYAYAMEAIEIRVVAKGSAAPGDTETPFMKKTK